MKAADPVSAIKHFKLAIGGLSDFDPDLTTEAVKVKRVPLVTSTIRSTTPLNSVDLYQGLVAAYLAVPGYADEPKRTDRELVRGDRQQADDLYGNLLSRVRQMRTNKSEKFNTQIAMVVSNIQRVRFGNQTRLPARWLALEGSALATVASAMPEFAKLVADQPTEDFLEAWRLVKNGNDVSTAQLLLAWSPTVQPKEGMAILDAAENGLLDRPLLASTLRDHSLLSALSPLVSQSLSLQESMSSVDKVVAMLDVTQDGADSDRTLKEEWAGLLMTDLAESAFDEANRNAGSEERVRTLEFGLWALQRARNTPALFVWERLPNVSLSERLSVQMRAWSHRLPLRLLVSVLVGALAFWIVFRLTLIVWRYQVLCRRSFYRPQSI